MSWTEWISGVLSNEPARSRRNRCPRPDWVPMFVHLEKRAGKVPSNPPPERPPLLLPVFQQLLPQESDNLIPNSNIFCLFHQTPVYFSRASVNSFLYSWCFMVFWPSCLLFLFLLVLVCISFFSQNIDIQCNRQLLTMTQQKEHYAKSAI